MKIGIFGDSFASLKLNPTPTWVDILSKKYDITNHSVSGSNLYYSVEQIKKFHLEYDKIVLVVTEPGRLQISDWIPVDSKSNQFVTGRFDSKYLNNLTSNPYEIHTWSAANQYFTYLQNNNYDVYIHNLMVKELKEIRPDIILIPAFLNSWANVKGASMHHIFLKENTEWNIGWIDTIEKYDDLRNCHMTAENNAIFAEKAEQWINGEPVHINLDDFVTTTNKDFYLKPK